MAEALDQALFGYSQGHRLIAASAGLDRESSRVLRSVTDMRFGTHSRSFLTVLPLPRMGSHAFIKTWPASAALRPGSVWSHVLLVPHVVLDDVPSVRPLQTLFVQPTRQMEEDQRALVGVFAGKLKLDMAAHVPPIPNDRANQRDLEKLVSAAYGESEPIEVVVDFAEYFDDSVLGLMDQQWAALRREFSARTRFRGSTSTVAAFAISVVERPSARTARPKPRSQRWVSVLAEDLVRPNESVRSWLRVFGPETPRGREDVPALVSVIIAAEAGKVPAAVELISKRFAARTAMNGLKDALFGPSDASYISIGQWPKDDGRRLRALLRVTPQALDYRELQVARRIATARDRGDVAAGVRWEELDTTTRRQLLGDLASLLPSRSVVEIALTSPVTTELLALRPDTWAEPALWVSSEVGIAQGLLTSADKETRSTTLRGLVERHDLSGATYVTGLDPTLWWRLVEADASATVVKDSAAADIARRLIEEFGAQQVGAPDPPPTADQELLALNAAAPADAALWRFVASKQWVDLGDKMADALAGFDLDRDDLCQLLIIVLAAGQRSGDSDLRGRAWNAVFGQLHHLLAGAEPPDGAVRTLDELLPIGPRWDWCGRLREGLATTAVEDSWKAEDLARIASRTPSFAPEVKARAAALRERKERSLLEGFLRLFRL
jgi:hypothetical protein